MKNSRNNSTVILVSTAVGAVLMALAIAVVFGLETGFAGAVLAAMLIIVAAATGWLIGWNHSIRHHNYYSYMRGYREGLAKKTVVIEQQNCRCTFTMPDIH